MASAIRSEQNMPVGLVQAQIWLGDKYHGITVVSQSLEQAA